MEVNHLFRTLRSVFVFFAVFMFLFCSMNSPILASFSRSALGETLSLSLLGKISNLVRKKEAGQHSHNPRMRKFHPFFFSFETTTHASVDNLSNRIFIVQNKQLSKYPYNIARYLYSIRALFVLCFVQLDNKSAYFCFLDRSVNSIK